MKKLTYKNFTKGVLVISELKNAVFQIDWEKRIFSINSESITFPGKRLGTKLLKKYKVNLSGLTTHKLKKE